MRQLLHWPECTKVVALHQAARGGQQERESQIRCRIGEDVRGIGDQDAPGGRGGHIDIS